MHYLEKKQEELILNLRKALHNCAEISGQEFKTKAMLIEFLQTHSSLEVLDCGAWFYAVHRENNTKKHSIALRADYDAVDYIDGARHVCGHDGHSAALCAVALAIEGKCLERDVFLLFQPAEETGEGGPICCELFEREEIAEIFGLHNLPGYAFGEVYTRTATFACASRGLSLVFQGKPTHAAYPNLGISPSEALGEFLVYIPELTPKSNEEVIKLCTVIGTKMGEKTFGTAASRAEVWLTLRSEYDEYVSTMQSDILAKAEELAKKYSLELSWDVQDIFPATCNHAESAEKLLKHCNAQLLQEPMRWSEDFGWYLQRTKGAFFGIGAGENYPALHTIDYEYPDELLKPSVEAFMTLVENA